MEEGWVWVQRMYELHRCPLYTGLRLYGQLAVCVHARVVEKLVSCLPYPISPSIPFLASPPSLRLPALSSQSSCSRYSQGSADRLSLYKTLVEVLTKFSSKDRSCLSSLKRLEQEKKTLLLSALLGSVFLSYKAIFTFFSGCRFSPFSRFYRQTRTPPFVRLLHPLSLLRRADCFLCRLYRRLRFQPVQESSLSHLQVLCRPSSSLPYVRGKPLGLTRTRPLHRLVSDSLPHLFLRFSTSLSSHMRHRSSHHPSLNHFVSAIGGQHPQQLGPRLRSFHLSSSILQDGPKLFFSLFERPPSVSLDPQSTVTADQVSPLPHHPGRPSSASLFLLPFFSLSLS
jgi:hypothetical protein